MKPAPPHFPRVVAPMPNEIAISYIARLAWANGFEDVIQFSRVTGIKASLRRFPHRDAEMLADRTGKCMADLSRYTAASYVYLPFGESIVRRTQLNSKGFRYCAECIQDAQEKGADPYIHGPWQWQVITHCPVHGSRFSVHLPDPRQLKSFSELAESTGEDDPLPHASNQYFYQRLAHSAGTSFLDTLPAYLAADVCFLLGQCLGMQERKVEAELSDFHRGFDIASEGEETVWSFLAEHVHSICRRVQNPRQIYLPFLQWWSQNKHDQRARPVMAFVQQHAEAYVALKPGEQIVWPVAEQKVHTVQSACREYGLSEKEVEQCLAQSLGYDELPYFFQRADFERALSSTPDLAPSPTNDEAIDFDSARRELGSTALALKELVRLGYLRTIELEDAPLWRGCKRRWISSHDLRRFAREYVSLDELASRQKLSRTAILEKLSVVGIKPIFQPRFWMTMFFPKRDVDLWISQEAARSAGQNLRE